MAQEQQATAPDETEEPQDRLDPETRARREAALRHVRKYGDPALRPARGRSRCSTPRSPTRCAEWAS